MGLTKRGFLAASLVAAVSLLALISACRAENRKAEGFAGIHLGSVDRLAA